MSVPGSYLVFNTVPFDSYSIAWDRRQVAFLVAGAAKAETLRAVLEGPADRLPAQFICPLSGQLTWLVDVEAASHLRRHA